MATKIRQMQSKAWKEMSLSVILINKLDGKEDQGQVLQELMMIFRQPIKIEFQGKDVLPGMQEYAADILPINAFLDYDIWKAFSLFSPPSSDCTHQPSSAVKSRASIKKDDDFGKYGLFLTKGYYWLTRAGS
ncbi:hypothetical protein P8452_16733 [Trifolium repens]|nr:hypothetical protein P8452_16733 [Trifolium repens]